jgi:hypothetical protein
VGSGTGGGVVGAIVDGNIIFYSSYILCIYFEILLFLYLSNQLGASQLPVNVINDLWAAVSGGSITIINQSNQRIEARVDTSYFFESGSVYQIYPGSSEKWSRLAMEVVRIHTSNNLWHDFKLSPHAVVKFTSDYQLQIVDGQNTGYQWNSNTDGPHIA